MDLDTLGVSVLGFTDEDLVDLHFSFLPILPFNYVLTSKHMMKSMALLLYINTGDSILSSAYSLVHTRLDPLNLIPPATFIPYKALLLYSAYDSFSSNV